MITDQEYYGLAIASIGLSEILSQVVLEMLAGLEFDIDWYN